MELNCGILVTESIFEIIIGDFYLMKAYLFVFPEWKVILLEFSNYFRRQ